MAPPSRVALPDFPWDSLEPAKAVARAHPDGIVDLSVGTPVDPTPEVVRRALADASDAHGYPQTYGTPALREAVAGWFERRRGVPSLDPAGVLPTVGSKELVAWLPLLLGLGPGDQVGIPAVAYPTYDVGTRIARAEPVVVDLAGDLPQAGAIRLLWVNSPSNPTGAVHDVDTLARVVRWARDNGVVVASDECYAELVWDDGALVDGLPRPGHVPSILDPRVNEGSTEGLLACYSLSKQSNLAGYRAALVAGDPRIVKQLLEIRKHAGMIVPWPVQEAMRVALGDDAHVAEQRARYAERRAALLPALQGAGLRVDHSEAGLYLWSTRDEDCWTTVDALAQHGILVAPGAFYGAAGERHVRVALTAPDERIQAAVRRLSR
ncbi:MULTISPECIES: succinyldiaminopimelate transaminase [Arsenicicoccus]|uniref:succinyldiaminopimelate transaminase n=1 Tax=Arsenicicoccus TaxID=267408 RepID=UPI002579CF1A|nr:MULTISPECIES: succinyldiaminopimelate transaminase [Arsenicicoccus]